MTAKESMEMFSIGDVVKLKSGSPPMTVTGFNNYYVEVYLRFVSKNGVPQSMRVPPLALRRVKNAAR